MKLHSKIRMVLALVVLTALAGCEEEYLPKPQGYFRIDLPEHAYLPFEAPCPVSMEVPKYARIEMRKEQQSDSCWFNVVFPRYRARVYCTYLPVGENLDGLVRDAYGFAAKHEMKASAIRRSLFENREEQLYGILYDIEGEAASQVQFFLTDSTQHFFRGALYFNHRPNPDSIAPVLAFLREDILHMVESVRWR